MDDLIADFHIHSKYSHDSLMSPERIVKRAKKAGLTAIAITDHDTIRGGKAALDAGKQWGIRVVVGSEVRTDAGDIIGLNLTEEIKSREWQSVLEEIRSQGGIAVLPHPYRDHIHPEATAGQVDFIEVWNSRCTTAENDDARQLAASCSKPGLFGSDAHSPEEIGLVKIRVNPESFEIREVICANKTSAGSLRKSQIVSHLKRGELRTLVKRGTGFLWKKVT
nr:PHP domain-containing protein [uncultured Methanoregula sp.]